MEEIFIRRLKSLVYVWVEIHENRQNGLCDRRWRRQSPNGTSFKNRTSENQVREKAYSGERFWRREKFSEKARIAGSFYDLS